MWTSIKQVLRKFRTKTPHRIFELPLILGQSVLMLFKLRVIDGLKPTTPASMFYVLSYAKYHLGVFPDLKNPQSYNDKIQWLKLFDYDTRKTPYADKVLAKEIAKKRCPEINVPETLQVVDKFSDLKINDLPAKFVIKTNHDSGGCMILDKKELSENIEHIENWFNKQISEKFGVWKGEWHYSQIKRKIFVEEYLDDPSEEAMPDFKFHCVHGKVRFVIHLRGRGGLANKEAIFTREGKRIEFTFNQKYEYDEEFERPAYFDKLVSIAERLAEDFKCVRIDLYDVNGGIYFAEYTFFGSSGAVQGEAQAQIFGPMLGDVTHSSDGAMELHY